MNRVVNVLLLFLLIPTLLFCIYVGFDMPISFLRMTGQNLPFRFEIFLTIGLFFMVVILRKSFRRWMGIRIVCKVTKFKWNQPVSKDRKSRVRTYLLLETAVMAFSGVALYSITEEALFPALAFLIGALDNLLIALVSKSYRVGLSSKALIVADREVVVMYFTGLRKVSVHQQTVFFDYIKSLQLSFPLDCIQEDARDAFFEVLEEQIDRDKVFFSKIK